MSTPAYSPATLSGLQAALNYLVAADPQDSTKHKEVKQWFEDNFGVAGRASVVNEAKQAYNRVPEQFKHLDPHVIFVVKDDDTLGKLIAQVQKKAYAGLQTVLFVEQTTTGGLKPRTLLYNGQSSVRQFYQAALVGIVEHPLNLPATAGAPIAATPAAPYVVATTPPSVDWNAALSAVDPCGLIGLQRAMAQALAALRAGKHVILLGPPGTGKTELAQCLCNSLKVPYDLSTATSEWTTFDTIGGYFTVPGAGNNLDFVPGVVTSAIEKNRWLVVDELNRADIDKALGELFTVFAGAPVSLPFKKEVAGALKTVAISFDDGTALEPDVFPYLIQPDWRVIGTMNTFDKASLYQLSFAFMRRFAFVNVDPPGQADFAKLISTKTADLDVDLAAMGETDTASGLLGSIFAPPAGSGLDALKLQVGPAIFLDVVTYLRARASGGGTGVPFRDQVAEALAMYLFPQFEGREQDHEAIINALASTLKMNDDARAAFSARLADWTGYREVVPG
jgi:Ni2+-binding GTPase involved in maturation of urease and hydrogenase